MRDGLRVLVVDQDESFGSVVGNALRDDGHEPLVVTTGEAALQHARRQPFEAVLLDLVLPDMTGCEVAKTLRALVPDNVAIIAITSRRGDASDADEAGIDIVLAKPVPYPLLGGLVRYVQKQRNGRARPQGR